MCELLGLCFNQPVTSTLSFRGFRHRGRKNPDGWGIAYFSSHSATVEKEPVSVRSSRKASTLLSRQDIRSRIFIAHVREATRGGKTMENTHPFRMAFRNSDFVFAHNGTMDLKYSPRRFPCSGSTDSELLFHWMLEWMEQDAVANDDFPRIEGWLRERNAGGTMNLLFSNGELLYVYPDLNGHNGGLSAVERRAPFPPIQLKDEDWIVDLNDEKSTEQFGFVIATRPLTNEKWSRLSSGRLHVLRNGARIYPDPS